MRALLKALRLVKQNREVAIGAMMKFSELDRELAAHTYDGMIGTFTTNGVVDEETQKKRSRHRSRGPQSHKGSSHRARLRFQLRKKSGQRADPSGLETLETITGGALRSAEISADYVENARPIVRRRLAQVGIRLAWVLNTALK